MPQTFMESARRRQELHNLREVMRRASVPEPTIDQVIDDVQDSVLVSGYVYSVYTEPTRTFVTIKGVACR
jgi:hypothetical protein